MDQANETPLDYYLLPTPQMSLPRLRLAQTNGLSLDAYRFDNLDYLFSMAEREPIAEVA